MRKRPDFGKDAFVDKCLGVLAEFGKIKDPNGRLGKTVTSETVSAVDKFLRELPISYRDNFIPEKELSVTSDGTVVLDFYMNKFFVSVEILSGSMGFFSELPSGRNHAVSGIPVDGTHPLFLMSMKEIFG